MDEIKNSFDKIMEQFQFSESISHAVPKRLSFGLNDFETSISKKRKLSLDKSDAMQENNIDKNSSRESLNSSIVSNSPWEARRVRADLLEARSRIAQLRQEIDQQHTVRGKLEIMYNNKVSALEQQCEFSSNKVLDMEKHLSALRKREASTKAELVKTKNQLNQQKQNYEDTIYSLQRTTSELEETNRCLRNSFSNESSDYKRQMEVLQSNYDLTREELDSLKEIQQEYKEKALKFDELSLQLEQESQDHSISQSKIKELEYEIASYGEWKELSKASHNRLSSMPDIEKEVTRLRQDTKNLRDSLGNKLLLEEQVFDLKSRLEKYENNSGDVVALKIQVNTLEQQIKEWQQIAIDHCPSNTPLNPMFLRSRIEQILQKDLILTNEKGNSKNEKDCIQSQVGELQSQNEIYTKANNDLKAALKHHKNILMRVQKKLMLVAKERDCYKQLVENFEKDLTISGAIAETLNPDAQLRSRLEMLEKTLCGYKEMCNNLEKELASAKLLPDLPLEMPQNTDSYERLKKEIETLRLDNERLRRRKEELELEMEHRCLKGDFNQDKFKIVHMTMNPAAEAYESSKNEIEKLQAEIERLKRKIRKLEENNEEMTTRLNDTSNLTANVKEMNSWRAKAESLEAKMQQLKDLYKSARLEFREVCYMLFGYRVDRVANTNYRISSMYASEEEEYLNFRLNESGVLDMLETEYSISLNEMMRTHLGQHNSLPAFLSALTLELFNRTTIMV